jgi:GT2 family glycosyltransferase
MSPQPEVTIVIPTAGRVALTRACLESIQVASASDDVHVAIIVVDSSSVADQTQLRKVCDCFGAELLPCPVSVSEKRNIGVERASTDYVMFVDSDCSIAPGCLASHLRNLEDQTIDVSQGTVLFRGPESLPFRAIRCSGILNAFLPPHGQPVTSAASGNLMVRRKPFLQVRFDPRLGPPAFGGEDVDFGLRLAANGFRIVAASKAIVYHDTATWNGAGSSTRRFFSWGRSEAHLIERHPSVSYLDMPSPVVVTLLLIANTLALVPWSRSTLIAIPAGFAAYITFASVSGAYRYPQDRPGGALAHWVFFILDAGRVFECIVSGRPSTALRRLRFTDDQVTQEWPDLVPTAWATWLMVLVGLVTSWCTLL